MLIGGAILITFAGLGMSYSQQTNDQSRLNQELAQAKLILTKSSPDGLASQKDELEKRLAQSQSRLEALRANLSPVVQSIEASDALFDIAEASGVEVIGTRSNAPSAQELNGAEYSTLWLGVKLEGEVANIIRFIHAWTEEHPTGVVKSLRIGVTQILEEEGEELGETGEEEELAGEEEESAGEGEGEEEAETESQKPSADIELIIYTYQGG
jgi:hypothetical protein